MNQDLEHLRWLSIGFYVNAAITGLFSLLPFLHVGLGVMMVSGALDDGKNPQPPAFFGYFIIAFAALFILMGFTLAICNLLAGKYLNRQTKYTFCFVIGVVNCLFMPLGTILGIFTIIVLARDSVKNLFNNSGAAQFSNSPGDLPNWR